MADYEFLYWSVPFRGQFVRAVLAHAGASWTEGGDDRIGELMASDIADMPVPFMGPPVLIDTVRGTAIAQMPAIILYLGEIHGLLPQDPGLRAMTLKITCDANDVIDEITLNGGQKMWTEERWADYVPRLEKWMGFWEETGRRHGLGPDGGYLLGGEGPGIADVITATLWTTMSERFSRIRALLDDTAPLTAALCRRVAAEPALVALAEKARRDYGGDYAGGQIGASMAQVLDR
ncbi:glutathione S-transferase [Devosia crocina]|uniref:Glutathione S-transferase n=1 Tax=Devosia crocina TaxID=429728 RepID=A0A1I7NRV9_9HYPH|nr:glutathione S-transferase [Devosia crocina]SFV37342.1 glutathione S-transferase [Devosia crocina]